MSSRVTVIGGGHGLAAVLAALRQEPCQLTVVVRRHRPYAWNVASG